MAPGNSRIYIVRSIFWFICISSAACLLIMVLYASNFCCHTNMLLTLFRRLLPETLRIIVGDGSFVPSAIYRPIIPIIGRKTGSGSDVACTVRSQVKPPRNPFKFLMNVDVLLLLVLNSIICAIYYGFIASLPTLFTDAYPFLNSTTIGVCYLGVGGGMAIGGWANGRYLDWEYERVSKGTPSLEKGSKHYLGTFPFEQVRDTEAPGSSWLLLITSE
jgi:hypothetical protein